jgi:hypothetical protein
VDGGAVAESSGGIGKYDDEDGEGAPLLLTEAYEAELPGEAKKEELLPSENGDEEEVEMK